MGTHSPLRSNNKRERLLSRIFNPVWPPLKLKSARSWEQPPLSSHPTTQPTTLRTRRHVAPSPTPKSPITTRTSSTTTRRTRPSPPRTRKPWTPPSVPLLRAPTPRTPSRMPPAPVSAYLPPTHPKLEESDSGKICPVTNATLEHHKQKVHTHPAVAKDAPIGQCPVAKNMLNA